MRFGAQVPRDHRILPGCSSATTSSVCACPDDIEGDDRSARGASGHKRSQAFQSSLSRQFPAVGRGWHARGRRWTVGRSGSESSSSSSSAPPPPPAKTNRARVSVPSRTCIRPSSPPDQARTARAATRRGRARIGLRPSKRGRVLRLRDDRRPAAAARGARFPNAVGDAVGPASPRVRPLRRDRGPLGLYGLRTRWLRPVRRIVATDLWRRHPGERASPRVASLAGSTRAPGSLVRAEARAATCWRTSGAAARRTTAASG